MIQKVSQSPRVFHFKRLLSMGVFAFDHHPRSVERTFIHFNTSTQPRRRSKSVVPILGRWRAWGQPVDVGEGRATNQPFFSRVPSRNQWSLISQAKWKMDINGIKMAKIWGDRSVFFFPGDLTFWWMGSLVVKSDGGPAYLETSSIGTVGCTPFQLVFNLGFLGDNLPTNTHCIGLI